jgi:hypothetical protein
MKILVQDDFHPTHDRLIGKTNRRHGTGVRELVTLTIVHTLTIDSVDLLDFQSLAFKVKANRHAHVHRPMHRQRAAVLHPQPEHRERRPVLCRPAQRRRRLDPKGSSKDLDFLDQPGGFTQACIRPYNRRAGSKDQRRNKADTEASPRANSLLKNSERESFADFPFMLRLSKHSESFFSKLLSRDRCVIIEEIVNHFDPKAMDSRREERCNRRLAGDLTHFEEQIHFGFGKLLLFFRKSEFYSRVTRGSQ